MKKALLALFLIVMLALLAVYALIPSKINITKVRKAEASPLAAHRVMMNDSNWMKWWPHETDSNSGMSFRITKKMLNAFEIATFSNSDSAYGVLQLIPLADDSIELHWKTELVTGKTPTGRLSQYLNAAAFKKKITRVLDSLKNYLSDKKNIYGFDVNEVKVVDSVLISTRRTFDHYPDQFEVDDMLKKLRAYIIANNAKEMNYPMLHVRKTGTTHFEAMAAIATDIELPNTKEFEYKRLLKGGNLLEAEVKGGYATIRNAFLEYENYIRDYKYTSPAIPYELIITDRVKEPDTAKWITRVYYPVF